jgi:hypothetical protein
VKNREKIAHPAASPKKVSAVAAQAATVNRKKKSDSRRTTKPPAVGEAAEQLDVVTEVTHEILLDAEDWYRATWRDLPPLERPAPRPFDRAASIEALSRLRVRRYGDWPWETFLLSPAMTSEEATFWYTAMLRQEMQSLPTMKPKELAQQLAEEESHPKFDPASFQAYARDCSGGPPSEIVACLSRLLPPEKLVALLVDAVRGYQGTSVTYLLTPLFEGLAEFCLPYWTPQDREKIGRQIRTVVRPKNDTSLTGEQPPPEFFFAALVGLHDELEAVVSAWPDDAFEGQYLWWLPSSLILGLGDPRSVEMHMRRLGLLFDNPLKRPVDNPRQLRAWLAHTEYGALDIVRDSIAAETNKNKAVELIDVLARVHAPAAAAPMLELKSNSRVAQQAIEWLDRYVGCGVAGALEMAGGAGKLARAATEYLREMKRRGHSELIETLSKQAAADTAARVRRDVLEGEEERVYPALDNKSTPAWLAQALQQDDSAKTCRLPAWADPEAAPPVLVGKKRLSDEQVTGLLKALKQSQLAEPNRLIIQLRQKADPAPLAAFAWHLFQRWLDNSAPPKEKWAFLSLGYFGDDEVVLKLTPMLRTWPGESQHQRAVLGLECLRAIGSDTALMQLNGIAQKAKHKGIKHKAIDFMEAIAEDRGMTRDELEDRVVPDCDLDSRGTREFDFGPRKFTFVLSPAMKPMVRDEAGKIRKDLPQLAGKDDQEKAAAAVAAWKLLKKQIREVGKIQTHRLEQAMVTSRTWPVEQFERILVRHPLMTNFVRLLVWGGWDSQNKLTATFRVTDEQEFADELDNAVKLGKVAAVRIVHPLHLSDAQRARWAELFGDYGIIPPFAQLGRDVYALEKGEAKQKEIRRFDHLSFPSTTFVSTLDRLGWTRGIPQDGGSFTEHSKPFYGADVTAVIQYPGVQVGFIEDWEDQEIKACFFVPGIYTPRQYSDHKRRKKLGDVDAVVISEVLRDLTLLASKGK